ncbi:hypothetical protein RHMOL_Rhmol09G0102200 [Rhododendron molle]|uniref:Uncharacterized protein n=1 Tax=Rhododendron molle TaxID=49168 RepID=A0ACC0MC06_RHOML|nr:hypothetical protein RHMOL_Rhmol09G0102200 [Rhododendron molle]
MTGQAELVELKKAIEEMNQKMDEQTILLQGLVDLLTPAMPNLDLGRNAGKARIKEAPQTYHPPTVGAKPCSKGKPFDLLKDLAKFHDVRAYSNENIGSSYEASAEGQAKQLSPTLG